MAAPTLAAISDVTVLAGAPLNIVLDGFDADNDQLQYSVQVTSNNGNISTYIPTGNQSLRLHLVQKDAQGTILQDVGIMEFQLFEDLAPETTARIVDFVNQGFYDDLTFHRIIKNFMIQGGDPAGTGSGGTGEKFDDEFDLSLRFTSSGLLAMAKTTDDTNDSQFFITAAPTRWLDFQHTIFGFLTKGDDVRNTVNNVATNASNVPTNKVVIASAEIFTDNENGVLRLSAPVGASGTSVVTVTVSDGHGGTATRTFNVTVAADAAANNGNPFLKPIADMNAVVGQTVSQTLTAADAENNLIGFWGYSPPTGIDYNYGLNAQNEPTKYKQVQPTNNLASTTLNIITTTPGKKTLRVLVLPGSANGSDDGVFDTQDILINVSPDAPTAIDLLDASDNGASATDNFTSRDNSAGKTLQFKVSGVWQGATVELKIGDRVIGTATVPAAASGATPTLTDVTITTNGTEVLAAGLHTITAVQKVDGLESAFSPALNIVVNTPTVLPPISNKTVDEGSTLSFSVAVTDPDVPGREAVTYSLGQGAPQGATIHPTTGLFQWTPTESQGGQAYPIVVNVLDSFGNTVSQQFSVTVGETNQPPEIVAPPELTVVAGQSVSHNFTATDPDLPANTLTYSLAEGSPAAASITPAGHFVYAPALGHLSGPVVVTVLVDDGQGGTDSQQVTINVQNAPPQLNPIGNKQVVEGGTLLFTATTVEELGQHVLFHLAPGAPAGIFFDDHGGFVWQTTEADGPGEYQITVIARNATGEEDSETITITVLEQNQAPELNVVDPQTIDEGTTLSLQLVGSDPDIVPDNLLTYSLVSGPGGATVDPTSGLLTWQSTESDGGHEYTFVVKVTDPSGESATREFTTTVNEVNRDPSINGAASHSVQAGETLNYTFTATDPDLPADTLSFSLADGSPEGASITTDGQFTFASTAGHSGTTINVTIQVSDGKGGSDSKTIAIHIGQLPVLEPIPDRTVDEGEFVLFTATATSSDPLNSMSYHLGPGAPAGAVLDEVTGAFVWQTSESQGGQTYTITVIARDENGLEVSQEVQITVNEVNQNPTISAPPELTIAAGETATHNFTATDPDLPANSLVFSLADGSPSGASITPQGLFQYVTTSTHYTETVNVTVVVSDGQGGTTTQTISVRVEQQPIFDPIANREVTEGATVLFTATAHTSEPLNHFTYRLAAGAPAGAFLDEDSGAFIWQTSEADGPGVYEITVIARDSHGLEVSQTVFISILEENTAPTIDPLAPVSLQPGEVLDLLVSGHDLDIFESNTPDTLTYGLGDGAPAGVAIDPATGRLTWTPAGVAPGVYAIPLVVTDSTGLSAAATLEVTVVAENVMPGDDLQALANAAAFPGIAADLNALLNSPSGGVNNFNAFNGLPPGVNVIGQGLGSPNPGTLPFTEMIAPQNLDSTFFFRSFDSENHLGADTGVGTHWTPGARTTNRPLTPAEGNAPDAPVDPAAVNPRENRNAKAPAKQDDVPSQSAHREVEHAHDAAVSEWLIAGSEMAVDAIVAGARTEDSAPQDTTLSEDNVSQWHAAGARLEAPSRDARRTGPTDQGAQAQPATSASASQSSDDRDVEVTAAALSAVLLTPLAGSTSTIKRDSKRRPR
ncbi:MAG: peptidylprolyl isomerase [Planctomycetaceae bacterium]|nr:peptidylprolyl isomerase [Planctomycetaceae bacterium]